MCVRLSSENNTARPRVEREIQWTGVWAHTHARECRRAAFKVAYMYYDVVVPAPRNIIIIIITLEQDDSGKTGKRLITLSYCIYIESFVVYCVIFCILHVANCVAA